MKTVSADAIEVTVRRAGIVLVFGVIPSRQLATGKEGRVRPSDRIVLSPLSARRLSVRLREILRDHGPELDESGMGRGGRPESTAQETTAPELRQDAANWDEVPVATTYANATEVTHARDTIDILFGVEPIRQAGQDAAPMRPVKQVSLSPIVAKRLAIALDKAVDDQTGHEEPAAAVPVGRGEVESEDGRKEPAPEDGVDKLLLLFHQMGGLDTKVDFEPSFKAVRDRLLANRLLLGFDRLQTDASRDEEIASVCERIGMPSSLLAAFRQGLPDANHVYFGAEKNDRTLVLKAYLEFRDRIEKEIRGAPVAGRSFSLFTGFKWDAFAPARQVVSRYVWHRSLPVPEILERLQATIDPSRHGALLELVQGIVRQASERIAPGEIQYLEVTEEGNPRRSFDLNVYKSGLRLQDLNPELLRALAYYGIPFSRFAPLYQRIKRERLGHLAGGVDREGNDFMTVYYGVHEVHSSQLGSAMVVQEDRPPQPRW